MAGRRHGVRPVLVRLVVATPRERDGAEDVARDGDREHRRVVRDRDARLEVGRHRVVPAHQAVGQGTDHQGDRQVGQPELGHHRDGVLDGRHRVVELEVAGAQHVEIELDPRGGRDRAGGERRLARGQQSLVTGSALDDVERAQRGHQATAPQHQAGPVGEPEALLERVLGLDHVAAASRTAEHLPGLARDLRTIVADGFQRRTRALHRQLLLLPPEGEPRRQHVHQRRIAGSLVEGRLRLVPAAAREQRPRQSQPEPAEPLLLARPAWRAPRPGLRPMPRPSGCRRPARASRPRPRGCRGRARRRVARPPG